MNTQRIITVGISPCWDIECRMDGVDWGDHKKIASQTSIPAGKALNVSRALAWMNVQSIAAGLWGQSDYHQMADSPVLSRDCIDVRFTRAAGKTRQNITIVDTKAHREMHLRADSNLATRQTLTSLKTDLEKIVAPSDYVIFSGALPEILLDDCMVIFKAVSANGARVIVDTSGPALKSLIGTVKFYLIKPNFEELNTCLDRPVDNETEAVVSAARTLCQSIEIVIVSLGEQGAVAVTKDRALHCKVKKSIHKTERTVGCGDYLLAGFVGRIQSGPDVSAALAAGTQAAAARAWGLTDTMEWTQITKELDVEITEL